MSPKYSIYIGIALESCFVSYVIVKSQIKALYRCVHPFSIAYSVYINSGTCNVGIIDHSYIPGPVVANNSWCAV